MTFGLHFAHYNLMRVPGYAHYGRRRGQSAMVARRIGGANFKLGGENDQSLYEDRYDGGGRVFDTSHRDTIGLRKTLPSKDMHPSISGLYECRL
jgi:hypothetical protein